MSEEEIFMEIRSVFHGLSGYDDEFQFKILQPCGGDSRTLMTPHCTVVKVKAQIDQIVECL